MNTHKQSPETGEGPRKELFGYLTGYAIALVLTLAAFAMVAFHVARETAVVVILVLAAVQVIVQMWFFLHLDLKKSHRDDLQLTLFTSVLGAVMFFGTLWILYNQAKLMG